jgi:hypothetical protein
LISYKSYTSRVTPRSAQLASRLVKALNTLMDPELLSNELDAFAATHPEFVASLKLANPSRFAPLPTAIWSRLPEGHALADDLVVGITYLDLDKLRAGETPLFKQDFFVRATDGTFVSYAAAKIVARAGSPYVQSIKDFERIYGEGGLYYTRPGHPNPLLHYFPDVADLPPVQHAEALELKRLHSMPQL